MSYLRVFSGFFLMVWLGLIMYENILKCDKCATEYIEIQKSFSLWCIIVHFLRQTKAKGWLFQTKFHFHSAQTNFVYSKFLNGWHISSAVNMTCRHVTFTWLGISPHLSLAQCKSNVVATQRTSYLSNAGREARPIQKGAITIDTSCSHTYTSCSCSENVPTFVFTIHSCTCWCHRSRDVSTDLTLRSKWYNIDHVTSLLTWHEIPLPNIASS